MPALDIFDRIEELRKTGQPFCVATVLRTADSTSAKAGGKAAITQDGTILGHLGGGCVQRAVRASVAEALAEGTPRMIRVKPSENVVAMVDPDGVQTFKSGCPSGGTVDLLIEPFHLPPCLVIFGDTLISDALAQHARLMGLRVVVAAATDDLEHIEARDFVVVASQGQGDLTALRAALSTPAARVSMVASRRKADTLCAKLAKEGISSARLAQLKSPAGLHIHAIDPHEIALSILAEIVMWRNAERESAPAARNGHHG